MKTREYQIFWNILYTDIALLSRKVLGPISDKLNYGRPYLARLYWKLIINDLTPIGATTTTIIITTIQEATTMCKWQWISQQLQTWEFLPF